MKNSSDSSSLTRRKFAKIAAGAGLGSTIGFPSFLKAGLTKATPKVAVVGADGMDPTLLHQYAAMGLMPNCKKLLDKGGFRKLKTTLPPQSPVAWATFVSGLDPGGHGIYDFITRDPATLTPELSTARTEAPKKFVNWGDYQFPLSSSKLELCRQGPALWDVLQSAGVPSWALRAPVNYPPSETKAKTLCGLTAPDIHGSYGIFSFYTTDPRREPGDVNGGSIQRVRFIKGVAHCTLGGPENSFRKDNASSSIDFTVERDPDAPMVRVAIQGRDVLLKEGEWSTFVPVNFTLVSHLAEVSAICRFYLKQVRPHMELYVSPVNIDPADPAFPVTTPKSYSKDLVAEVGRFYTQGMAEETTALSAGVLTDAEFRNHALFVLDSDIKIFRSQLNDFREGFFYSYFSSLDMNSHMFWRTIDTKHPLYTPELAKEHGDHLPTLYRRIDDYVGDLLEHIGSDGHIYIASDHAFTSFRRQFNLNSWLLDHGYSGLKNRLDRSAAPNFVNTDWTHTRAYGLGINSLYLNIAGREPDGVVQDGAAADRLRDELIAKLTAVRDPQTGLPVIRRVIKPDQSFRHTNSNRVPDLIVCYNDNYRSSWDTILGGYPQELILDNKDPWSGDHCMDPDFLSGVLLTNAPLKEDKPALEDLAPTIIKTFEVKVPEVMKGEEYFGVTRWRLGGTNQTSGLCHTRPTHEAAS